MAKRLNITDEFHDSFQKLIKLLPYKLQSDVDTRNLILVYLKLGGEKVAAHGIEIIKMRFLDEMRQEDEALSGSETIDAELEADEDLNEDDDERDDDERDDDERDDDERDDDERDDAELEADEGDDVERDDDLDDDDLNGDDADDYALDF